jgi:hypothetical protein
VPPDNLGATLIAKDPPYLPNGIKFTAVPDNNTGSSGRWWRIIAADQPYRRYIGERKEAEGSRYLPGTGSFYMAKALETYLAHLEATNANRA